MIPGRLLALKGEQDNLPLLNFEWVVWRVKGESEPGAAKP